MLRLLLPLLLCACAPTPWIVRHHCEPPPSTLGPFGQVRCSDPAIIAQACLYSYQEQGIDCWEQLERPTCSGEWDETAHYCGIYAPDDAAAWDGGGP